MRVHPAMLAARRAILGLVLLALPVGCASDYSGYDETLPPPAYRDARDIYPPAGTEPGAVTYDSGDYPADYPGEPATDGDGYARIYEPTVQGEVRYYNYDAPRYDSFYGRYPYGHRSGFYDRHRYPHDYPQVHRQRSRVGDDVHVGRDRRDDDRGHVSRSRGNDRNDDRTPRERTPTAQRRDDAARDVQRSREAERSQRQRDALDRMRGGPIDIVRHQERQRQERSRASESSERRSSGRDSGRDSSRSGDRKR